MEICRDSVLHDGSLFSEDWNKLQNFSMIFFFKLMDRNEEDLENNVKRLGELWGKKITHNQSYCNYIDQINVIT